MQNIEADYLVIGAGAMFADRIKAAFIAQLRAISELRWLDDPELTGWLSDCRLDLFGQLVDTSVGKP